MELKDQLCSLELAKRLEELGVKQKSLFKYRHSHQTNIWVLEYLGDFDIKVFDKQYSAFTVAELGELLPDNVIGTLRLNGGEHSTGIRFDNAEYKVFRDKNEAEARAKMLIYLLENGLIKEGK